MLIRREVTGQILASAICVHRALGPGLLESAYEACMAHELAYRRLSVARQVRVPLLYRGHTLRCGFRIDLLVEDAIVVELKALDALLPIHEAQLLTYLRLSGKSVGLLINFNVPRLRDGIIRRVL